MKNTQHVPIVLMKDRRREMVPIDKIKVMTRAEALKK